MIIFQFYYFNLFILYYSVILYYIIFIILIHLVKIRSPRSTETIFIDRNVTKCRCICSISATKLLHFHAGEQTNAAFLSLFFSVVMRVNLKFTDLIWLVSNPTERSYLVTRFGIASEIEMRASGYGI